MGKSILFCLLVCKIYLPETNLYRRSVFSFFRDSASGLFCSHRIYNTALFLQHGADSVGTGQGLGYGHNQIRHLNQLHQNLRHVVDQSHGLSLGDNSRIHLFSGNPHHSDYGQIDDHIGNGIHQGGNLSYKNLKPNQLAVGLVKPDNLIFLPVKGPDYTCSCQAFSGGKGHLIQLSLHLFIQWHTPCHNPKYHHT